MDTHTGTHAANAPNTRTRKNQRVCTHAHANTRACTHYQHTQVRLRARQGGIEHTYPPSPYTLAVVLLCAEQNSFLLGLALLQSVAGHVWLMHVGRPPACAALAHWRPAAFWYEQITGAVGAALAVGAPVKLLRGACVSVFPFDLLEALAVALARYSSGLSGSAAVERRYAGVVSNAVFSAVVARRWTSSWRFLPLQQRRVIMIVPSRVARGSTRLSWAFPSTALAVPW